MASASDRIIVLTAIILVMVMVWAPNREPPRTIVSMKDLKVKINTSREYCTLGESFTAYAFLVNNRSEDVWIKPLPSGSIVGHSLNGTDPIIDDIHGDPAEELICIPVNTSKILSRKFTPLFTGEYQISFLGIKKIVPVIKPQTGNVTVHVVMNEHSFKNTDDATLYIANVGSNRITLGDKYKIQKKEGDSWVGVSPSLYRSIWLLYQALLDPEGVFRQTIKIDNLEPGQYRIIKEVYDDVTQEYITLFVEFEIQM